MSRGVRNGRSVAAVAVASPVRCAIYTRKSTDEGLDKDFNTLDAQRDAAEKYIASQEGDGWTALADRYDDGGFSGGNTNRPALQRLLRDIEAGKIDVVLVYKYDRLSRSMLDFLQLLQVFKRHGVSFVSVSQRFDTSTPVGEMTLNILLSFAQFERQIIAERTRDKMRAARRRGRWTGGMPPLGYDVAPEGGWLVLNKDEAEQVWAIFELYLEKGSLLAAAQELNRRGWRRKSWTTKDGKRREGRSWDRPNLHVVLTNPLYAGMQKLGDETFPGEHAAIVTKATFQKVQRLLEGNRRHRGGPRRNRHGALLRGILRCGSCNAAMVHTWTKHRGRAFRYYRCVQAIKKGQGSCANGSIPAQAIEDFVVDKIRVIGADPVLREETFRQVQAQVAAERRGIRAEAKRIGKDLADARAEVQRLVAAVANASGVVATTLVEALGTAQERVATLEARSEEIRAREAALAAQDIDPEVFGRVLEDFDPIWSVLLTPEKERVLRLLIERVSYEGATKQMSITFAPTGIAALATETGQEVAS